MTTYEFEVAAKNAVIDLAKEKLSIGLKIEDVDVVWMVHVLGYKKCLLMSRKTPFYYELTYNKEDDVIYFDVYSKSAHYNLYKDKYSIKVRNENDR